MVTSPCKNCRRFLFTGFLISLTAITSLAEEGYIWPRQQVHFVLYALQDYQQAIDTRDVAGIEQGDQLVSTALKKLDQRVTPDLSDSDEAQLAGLVNEFEGNQQAYLQIIDSLKGVGRDTDAARFERQVAGQAAYLLHSLDALTDSWSEVSPQINLDGQEDDFVYAIFGVHRLFIDDYLTNAFSRLTHIASRYAAPLVMFLRQVDPRALDAQIEDWHGLIVELNRYQMEDPGSTIVEVQRFLKEGIGQLRQSNCRGELARLTLNVDDSGFFATYQHKVIDRAMTFCRAASGQS